MKTNANYIWLTKAIFIYFFALLRPAVGQIVPDSTLPANSIITTDGSTITITGGTRGGGNLFHSFQDFSTPSGETVFFNNGIDVQNIITRVTGESISNINGLIQANGTANLFLLNPNGIVFGPSAELNIGGSFVASTANSLKFPNEIEFSAIEDSQTNPLLIVSIPIGLQYGENPNPIWVQGSSLNVESGKTLALIGGDIRLDGAGLTSSSGSRIELAGVAATGIVGIQNNGNYLQFNFPNELIRSDISLSGSFVVVNTGIPVSFGPDGTRVHPSQNLDRNSSIVINTRNLDLLNSSRIEADSFSYAPPFSIPPAEIKIDATGAIVLNQFSTINNNSGGDITIETESLSLLDGAQLSTQVEGNFQFYGMGGRAGTISVQADNFISLKNSFITLALRTTDPVPPPDEGLPAPLPPTSPLFLPSLNRTSISPFLPLNEETTSGISSSSTFMGFPIFPIEAVTGDINLEARSVSILEGSQISIGNNTPLNQITRLGSVNINVAEDLIISGLNTQISINVGTTTQAQTGNLNINAGSLLVNDGAKIQTSVANDDVSQLFLEIESAGNININVLGSVVLENSTISSNADNFGATKVGNITINTGSLLLTNGSQLRTTAIFDPFVLGYSENAGDIVIRSKDFVILFGNNNHNRSGLFANTVSSGNAGNIFIETNTFRISSDALINADTSQPLFYDEIIPAGRGGNVTVNANNFEATDGGQLITSASSSGNAGNITLQISEDIIIEDSGSGLLANTTPYSSGTGGSIFINEPQRVFISDRAGISVNSDGEGKAGNIEILNADSVVLSNRGFVSAETATRDGGNIRLQTNNLLLRQESNISATAGRAGASGNGGNISISTDTLAALENSDITANAQAGSGGQVSIEAQGIFGTAYRERESDATSDITASSERGPEFSGIVNIETSGFSPNSGLVDLPDEFVDVNRLVERRCTSGTARISQFLIRGRGGLPPNPTNALTPNVGWTDSRASVEEEQGVTEMRTPQQQNSSSGQIVEAKGWIINSQGEVILTSSVPNNIFSNSSTSQFRCSPRS